MNWPSRPPVISPLMTRREPNHSTPTMLATTRKMAIAVRPARASRRVARRLERALDGGRKAARHGRLLAEGGHGAHGAQIVGGVGGSVGQPVLRRARQPPHGPAVGQQRKHDGRNGRQRQGRQRRAGHEHHDERAGQHDGVAQRLAQRRAGRALDLRGVGGEAAHHLARVRRLVERRAERGQMAEHLRAQVGHHPLAQPVDGIHACRARHRQHQADDDQHGEILVDEDAVGAREAVVDHAPHGDRHRQHGGGRDDERDQRRQHHAGMAQDVGPQRHQRPQLAPVRGARFAIGVGNGQASPFGCLLSGQQCRCRAVPASALLPRRGRHSRQIRTQRPSNCWRAGALVCCPAEQRHRGTAQWACSTARSRSLQGPPAASARARPSCSWRRAPRSSSRAAARPRARRWPPSSAAAAASCRPTPRSRTTGSA